MTKNRANLLLIVLWMFSLFFRSLLDKIDMFGAKTGHPRGFSRVRNFEMPNMDPLSAGRISAKNHRVYPMILSIFGGGGSDRASAKVFGGGEYVFLVEIIPFKNGLRLAVRLF